MKNGWESYDCMIGRLGGVWFGIKRHANAFQTGR